MRNPLRFLRAGRAARALAAGVALAVVGAGSGLPMCLSLLAQAAAPCEMHSQHGRHAVPHHGPELPQLVTESRGRACHTGSAGLGCATGGACPSAGPAATAWIGAPALALQLVPTPVYPRASAPASHFVPPLSPPPQA